MTRRCAPTRGAASPRPVRRGKKQGVSMLLSEPSWLKSDGSLLHSFAEEQGLTGDWHHGAVPLVCTANTAGSKPMALLTVTMDVPVAPDPT